MSTDFSTPTRVRQLANEKYESSQGYSEPDAGAPDEEVLGKMEAAPLQKDDSQGTGSPSVLKQSKEAYSRGSGAQQTGASTGADQTN